ncbi:MAG: MBL fold metallo-hydrolase [Spirochaetaceae bacterium]|jgi:glyoxylase-like metal-dependent hydrolase (beta-lactamase superfamily II)|nr:MBL fold metallo-hydrolase [Spirochaetaceae bacterium]
MNKNINFVCLYLFFAALTPCFSQGGGGLFSYSLGGFHLWTIVEQEIKTTTSIILDDSREKKEIVKKKTRDGSYTASSNYFILKADGLYYLIDAGFGINSVIMSAFEKLDLTPSDISGIFLTHTHNDHIDGIVKNRMIVFDKANIYLSKKELEIWPPVSKPALLEMYGSRVKTFEPEKLENGGKEIIQGVYAFSAEGHTPGHTGYIIKFGEKKMLVIGDLIHVEDVQFENPDISTTYDKDPALAAETRKSVLRYAAKNNLVIAGMHLRSPAVGVVTAFGKGFVFIPLL